MDTHAPHLSLDPRELDWNLLRAFVAVAEHGSLTRAAEQLGTSQPTLSRQIASFESATRRALFERTARGLTLTQAGEALLEPARRVHAAITALSLAAAGDEAEAAGTVRITASEMTATYLLPPLLAELSERHPDTQIELVASNRIDNLLEREADIAIRMVEPSQSGLIARRIAHYPLGFYVHRDYVARHGLPRASDPLAHRWIGFDRSDVLIAGFRSAGFKIGREFFAFRCDNQIVCWQALLCGLGIGIAMERIAAKHPELVRVLPEMPVPDLPVWLTAHRELRDTPRIRRVYDFIAEGLARNV